MNGNRNNRFETTDAATYQLLLDKARLMRKNPTEAEAALWNYISDNKLGVHFRRQHPIYGYIPDFVSLKDRLIIEIDGGYHLEGEQPEKDAERTRYLNEVGFVVLRFTNEEVLCNIDEVLEEISETIDQLPMISYPSTIPSNTPDISSNTPDISSNTPDISSNTPNISSNTPNNPSTLPLSNSNQSPLPHGRGRGWVPSHGRDRGWVPSHGSARRWVVGFGYDVHRIVEGRKLWLGGICIPFNLPSCTGGVGGGSLPSCTGGVGGGSFGLLGHSDADVLIHAICDAMLGAANMRDIGYHFPDTSDETLDMDSKIILAKTVELIATKGYRLGNIDATICAERPKMNPHIPAMQQCLASVIGCDPDQISIKATTTERLGFTGREEGMSAYATVLLEK